MANLTNINGKFVVDTSGLGIFGDVGSSFSTPGGFGQLGVFKTSAAAMFTLQSSGGNGRQYTLLSQSNGAFVIYDGPSCDHRMEISSGGEVTFSGNVKVTGAFKDSSGDAGTSGQILSSTVTGTNWIDNDTGDVSGSGTTNAVAKFTGAKVIGDGPITFATNDSTFAGNIIIHNSSNAPYIDFVESGATTDSKARITMDQIDTNNGQLILSTENAGTLTTAIKILQDQNTEFLGGIKVNGPASYNTIKSANEYTLGFNDSNDVNQWWIKTYTNGAFALHENGVGDKFTITAGGNVGIGTTSPGSKLTVDTNIDSNSAPLLMLNAGLNDSGQLQVGIPKANNAYATGSVLGDVVIRNIEASSKLILGGTDSVVIGVGGTDFDPRMTIKSSGNVGIGTTSPLTALHIQDDSNIKLTITNDDFSANTTGTSFDVRFGATTGNTFTEIRSLINGRSAWGNFVLARGGGNVGIGTDSPSAKLEIRNDIAASTDLDPTAIKLYNNSDGGSAIEFSNGVSGNSKLSFGVESTGAGTDDTFLGFSTSANTTMSERMRITSAGNVGIGTTSPTYKLQVNGTAYINETLYVNGATTVDDNFYVTNGNVGIGTTSPTFKLQTNATIAGSWLGYLNGTSATFGTNNFSAVHSSTAIGTGTESGINLANNASDNGAPSPIISFSAKSASASYQHAYAAIYGIKTASGADANWNTGDLVFATGQSTGPIERMRIDSSGRVLINQSSNLTGQVLQVNGFIDILNVSASALRWYDGTTFISGLGLDSWATGGSASNMTMFCEGEFGIVTGGGNTKKLVMNTSGSVTVSGDLVAYGSPSDKRLKENIKPIKSALDKVSKLQGVTFNWKESGSILDIKEDVGFIAQDVQKVIPELVRENKDGMLSMRHQGIAPILLEAIKELKAEIEKLKSNKCNCNK